MPLSFLRTHGAALIFSIGAAVCVSFVPNARAQTAFPERSVKFIVPSPPGTMIDLLPRMLGEKLSARWGRPVIVENRPGAAHIIGAETVARAEPDGHTLLVTPPAPLVLEQWLDPKWAAQAPAFEPVTVLATFPQVLVVNPKVPVKTFEEWIAYAKANPGRMSYGSPGAGTTAQLAQEELARALGIELVHVPYQGMGPAINDLIAGHIETMFSAVGTALPFIEDGKLRPIAVTGGQRLARFPDLPVISETLPGFDHIEWFAVVAPPRTPQPTVSALWQAISEALRSPDIQDRLQRVMLVSVGNTPTEAAAFLDRERQRWRAIVERRAKSSN
jgi:tripartite-type tricarboxylate transporter receptor subunit TctC